MRGLPPAGLEVRERGVQVVATRYSRIDALALDAWSVRSTSGGPSVSSTAATRVPIASIANRARPPRTSVKYGEIAGDVAGRRVQEVEPFERCARASHPRAVTAGNTVPRIAWRPFGSRGVVDGPGWKRSRGCVRPVSGGSRSITPERDRTSCRSCSRSSNATGDVLAYWAVDRKPEALRAAAAPGTSKAEPRRGVRGGRVRRGLARALVGPSSGTGRVVDDASEERAAPRRSRPSTRGTRASRRRARSSRSRSRRSRAGRLEPDRPPEDRS